MKNTETVILLNGDLIIHERIIKIVWRLGDSSGRRLLRNFCTRREQNAVISEGHKRYGSPNRMNFRERLEFVKL